MSPPITRAVPSTGDAIGIMARLTLKRVFRGKLVWFVILAAGLPSLIALAMRGGGHNRPEKVATATFSTVQLLFAILVPMLTGSAVGDELGSKTASYLWSRPVARWTILVGKLVVLAPLTALILVVAWLVSLAIGGGLISPQALVAVAFGAITISVVVAAIATIGPKHGIAFSLLYVLIIDLGIALLPGSLSQLSLVHQTTVLAGLPQGPNEPPLGSALGAALWLVGLTAIWLTVALRQLRTREA